MSFITLQELQNMEKEKERCKNTYCDWKDDKFNCLDNKFIFAVKSSEDHSDEEPSFHTLNDFTVYYNRKSKMYFSELDLPLKCRTDLNVFIKTLRDIQEKFWLFLLHQSDNDADNLNKKYGICEIMHVESFDLFSAQYLDELCRKFRFFIDGYEFSIGK